MVQKLYGFNFCHWIACVGCSDLFIFYFYSIKIQDSTVRDDWYMDGKTLYQDSSRDQLAHDLGVFGVMRLSWHANTTDIRFELNYPTQNLSTQNFHNDTPLTYPDELSVHISHATDDTKDRDFTLIHQKIMSMLAKCNLMTPLPNITCKSVAPSHRTGD